MTPQSKSSSSSKQKKEMTFFDILKNDHKQVRDIFEEIEEDEGENKVVLFATLQSELQEHMELEEKFFYPFLEKSRDAGQKALEAYEEHNVAKHVLRECGSLDFGDKRWNARIKVLQEIVSHHLQEEEKNIFEIAKNSLARDQIQQITSLIMQQKDLAGKKAA